MEAAERWTTGNLRISIYADEDAGDPRKEWDNAAVLVCWHRRYTLGDRQPTDQEKAAIRRGGFDLLSRYLRRTIGAVAVLPLGLLDHSGITMYVGGGPHWTDTAGWDSGTVGFAYITKTVVEKEGIPEPEACIRGEVAEYDQYLMGDVWGYVIEDKDRDNDHLDSCWGFYGFDECKREAEGIAEGLLAAV